ARPQPRSPLFPYTTLFRSERSLDRHLGARREVLQGRAAFSFADAHAELQRLRPLRRRGDRVRPRHPFRKAEVHPLSRLEGEVARSEEHTSELQSLAYLVCR